MPRTDTPRRRGFTLVELVVVILILGTLAGIAAPRLMDHGQEAARAAFEQQLLLYVEAIERCYLMTGEYPADATSGEFPPELDPYLRSQSWERPTSLGGDWDVEYNGVGITAGVGVHYQHDEPPDESYFKAIDERLDNGDTGSGTLRWIARDRYYFVIQE